MNKKETSRWKKMIYASEETWREADTQYFTESINLSCHILAASFHEGSVVLKLLFMECSLTHAHTQTATFSGPDVGAAGASLCSDLLSLHEAAADGKHGANMDLRSRLQLWSRWAKPEPRLGECRDRLDGQKKGSEGCRLGLVFLLLELGTKKKRRSNFCSSVSWQRVANTTEAMIQSMYL